MSDQGLVETGPGRFSVNGFLNFDSVNRLLQDSHALFNETSEIAIDLSRVASADSAGVALLVEWTKMAKRQNARLSFHIIPHQIMEIAEACGLDGLLPFTDTPIPVSK